MSAIFVHDGCAPGPRPHLPPMTAAAAEPVPPAFKGPGFPEFVALIAMMMALNALAIDSMLPALPAIGEALGVTSENSRQWVITAYLLGFGVTQIIYGPLADRFGRKPILMIGLSLYVVFSVLAAFSPTFELLIAARVGAGVGAVASLLNARLVERLGSRLISHTALLGFITMSSIHAAVALTGHETILTFAVLQALTMFCFGFIAGNFGAMAMEPMGHIAGTASSAQGFISTTFGASLGFLIGQQFNGSAAPMTVGFVALGLAALAGVLFAERGQLFKARNLPPVPAPS